MRLHTLNMEFIICQLKSLINNFLNKINYLNTIIKNARRSSVQGLMRLPKSRQQGMQSAKGELSLDD